MLRPNTSDSTQLTDTSGNDEALDSLGIVVGEIAHDFNNILSLIFGYVEMALSELPEGERARSDLEHVLAAGDRANELVTRILSYSKSTQLKRTANTLEKPIKDAVDAIRQRLPQNIRLEMNLAASNNRFVSSNQGELIRIIKNLCQNSIQAMPDSGGDIEISLDYFDRDSDYAKQHSGLKPGDYARITVRDSGCGMDIDTIEKMYTPFFTIARRNSKDKNRAGLGLTTVFNIVTSYEGSIFVDSAPGLGTKFEICLPLLETEAKPDAGSAQTPKGELNIKHILLIDDEASILTMAKKMLELNGYTVTSFTDGNIALEYFKQKPHQFDLVITDLIMPTISGTELASKISEINPYIPIILTTGFSEKITKSACEQWGIRTVINKPFSIRELLSTIENQQ